MSKKSKQETGPSSYSKPYITGAANELQAANAANAPNIANISSTLQSNMPQVVASTLNNPTLGAANTYANDVLSGKYLNGNPNLQAIINNTNSDVANKANAAIGIRGGAGGSAQAQIMARELAKNEANLRYQDYSTERGYQDKGVADATALSGANAGNIQALLQYLTGQAGIPTSGAQNYANSVAGLMGNYNTTTQTQGIGNTVGGILGAGLSGWASGGFKGI